MVMEFSDPRMLPMPFNLIKRCIALITPVVDVLSRVVHVVRDCLCCRTRYYYSERLMKHDADNVRRVRDRAVGVNSRDREQEASEACHHPGMSAAFSESPALPHASFVNIKAGSRT